MNYYLYWPELGEVFFYEDLPLGLLSEPPDRDVRNCLRDRDLNFKQTKRLSENTRSRVNIAEKQIKVVLLSTLFYVPVV